MLKTNLLLPLEGHHIYCRRIDTQNLPAFPPRWGLIGITESSVCYLPGSNQAVNQTAAIPAKWMLVNEAPFCVHFGFRQLTPCRYQRQSETRIADIGCSGTLTFQFLHSAGLAELLVRSGESTQQLTGDDVIQLLSPALRHAAQQCLSSLLSKDLPTYEHLLSLQPQLETALFHAFSQVFHSFGIYLAPNSLQIMAFSPLPSSTNT